MKVFRNGKGKTYIVKNIKTVYVITPYSHRNIHVKNMNDFISKLKNLGYREEITR